MEAGENGLTRGTCFVARRLEVVAVAEMLWISWCVLDAAGFRCFPILLSNFERTPAASMTAPCLIYLSTVLLVAAEIPKYIPGMSLHFTVRGRTCTPQDQLETQKTRYPLVAVNKPTATKPQMHHTTRHEEVNNNGEVYVVGYDALIVVPRTSDG